MNLLGRWRAADDPRRVELYTHWSLVPAVFCAPVLVLGLGLWTLMLGGWRALRQTDVKLVLAYGTVSQLGFLMVANGLGVRDAALAGLAMLLAHALEFRLERHALIVAEPVPHAAVPSRRLRRAGSGDEQYRPAGGYGQGPGGRARGRRRLSAAMITGRLKGLKYI